MPKSLVDKNKILEILKQIYDPEIPVNIVELGLIYQIDIQKNHVKVKMTLTNPNCPVAEAFVHSVKINLEEIVGIDQADIELVWEPAWTMDKMTEEAKFKLGLL